jgi:hypothetical protein
MDLPSDVQSKLSPQALAALMSFMSQKEVSKMTSGIDVDMLTKSGDKSSDANTLSMKMNATKDMDVNQYDHVDSCNAGVSEDFGQSQFWYTTETSEKLAKEALSVGGTADDIVGFKRIAFVSCPSAFKASLRFVDDSTDCTVFEYDRRFGDVYGDQFCYYDFNHPRAIPEEFHHVFDYVMADPPYLDPNCMAKTIETMKLLARDENTPMCFNTGAVMAEAIYKHAGFRETRFHPEHASKLGNEFSSFTNYEPANMGGWYELDEEKQ